MQQARSQSFKVPKTETDVTFKDPSSLAITFAIPNFSLLKRRTEDIISPRIKIRRSSWHIRVTPKEVGEKGDCPEVVITVCHAFIQPPSTYVYRQQVAELVIR